MKIYIFLLAVAIFSLACGQMAVPTETKPTANKAQNKPEAVYIVPTSAATIYTVCTASLNLRSCAGTNCESLAVLPTGAQMTASAAVTPPTGGEWRRVVLAGGETGWVNARYICEVK